jgi:hypothetical protein
VPSGWRVNENIRGRGHDSGAVRPEIARGGQACTMEVPLDSITKPQKASYGNLRGLRVFWRRIESTYNTSKHSKNVITRRASGILEPSF